MSGGGVEALQIFFLLLLFLSVAFAALAQRLNIPYPIVLVIAGLALSFAPGVPQITLDPKVVFYVLLPPLLYSAAWQTSWREFSYNIVSILMLAIGLVAFTVAGVAEAAAWLFTGFDFRSGIVLGAVVSTTDAVAATSIANRLGLDRRIVDVLEGESLVNDATGLLALEFGVAMFAGAHAFTAGEGLLRLAYLVAVGVATGIAIAILVVWLERRIDNGPIEIAISLLVAYASYFAAEALEGSGVLAVVVSGMYLSRHSVHFFTPGVRIQVAAVWDALTFVLNGIVFLLIGLEFRDVVAGIRGYQLSTLIQYGALFAAIVILLRLIWVYPGGAISFFVRSRVLHQDVGMPPARTLFVVGWTGMRGVIALAAALSLPASIPHRSLILFLTFSVIVITLVVQGLTLPFLIRRLGLASVGGTGQEEIDARRVILQLALRHLEETREIDAERFADIYDDLAQHYQIRLSALTGEGSDEHGTSAEHAQRYYDLSRELIALEREKAVEMRNGGRINDEVLRRILHELDLNETRVNSVVT